MFNKLPDEIATAYMKSLSEAVSNNQLTGLPLVSALKTATMSRWYELINKFQTQTAKYDPAPSQPDRNGWTIFKMTPGNDVRDQAFESIVKMGSDLASDLNKLYGKDAFEPKITRGDGSIEVLVAFLGKPGGVFQAKAQPQEGHTQIILTRPDEKQLELAYSKMTDTPHPDDGGDGLGQLDNEFDDEPVAGEGEDGTGIQPDYNPEYDVASEVNPDEEGGDPFDDVSEEDADAAFDDERRARGRNESVELDEMRRNGSDDAEKEETVDQNEPIRHEGYRIRAKYVYSVGDKIQNETIVFDDKFVPASWMEGRPWRSMPSESISFWARSQPQHNEISDRQRDPLFHRPMWRLVAVAALANDLHIANEAAITEAGQYAKVWKNRKVIHTIELEGESRSERRAHLKEIQASYPRSEGYTVVAEATTVQKLQVIGTDPQSDVESTQTFELNAEGAAKQFAKNLQNKGFKGVRIATINVEPANESLTGRGAEGAIRRAADKIRRTGERAPYQGRPKYGPESGGPEVGDDEDLDQPAKDADKKTPVKEFFGNKKGGALGRAKKVLSKAFNANKVRGNVSDLKFVVAKPLDWAVDVLDSVADIVADASISDGNGAGGIYSVHWHDGEYFVHIGVNKIGNNKTRWRITADHDPDEDDDSDDEHLSELGEAVKMPEGMTKMDYDEIFRAIKELAMDEGMFDDNNRDVNRIIYMFIQEYGMRILARKMKRADAVATLAEFIATYNPIDHIGSASDALPEPTNEEAGAPTVSVTNATDATVSAPDAKSVKKKKKKDDGDCPHDAVVETLSYTDITVRGWTGNIFV